VEGKDRSSRLQDRIVLAILALGLLALIGSCLWSFWHDTLAPTIAQGGLRAGLIAVGWFILALAGLGVTALGGVLVFRGLGRFGEDERLRASITNARSYPLPVRLRNVGYILILWLRYTLPGLLVMALGIAITAFAVRQV
jgi:hypothetical protein